MEQRTILFRGKRVDNGEWIEGNLLTDKLYLRNPHICQKVTYCDFAPSFEEGMDLDEVMEKGSAYGLFLEVIPETVGQFTGLTDKNGTRIFEGDILAATQYIKFKANYVLITEMKWEIRNNNANGWTQLSPMSEFEVIGNIFDMDYQQLHGKS